MTEEELKKEAIAKYKTGSYPQLHPDHYAFIHGYLAGAEPREKRITKLEQQIEKLLDFVVERTEECDVCPLSETCANSEGVCPYRNKRINLKEWILRHIEVSTVQTETKQFLEYDKMPNCLGTQTTSGNW